MEHAHLAKQHDGNTRALPFLDVSTQRPEQRFDVAPGDRSWRGSAEDGGQRLGVFPLHVRMILNFSTTRQNAPTGRPVARDVSLLCPPKPSTTDKVGGRYHKSQFVYDADQDVYVCPAGQKLQRISHTRVSPRSREQMTYACSACATCPQRTACTRSTRGRRIKRYPEDEARLALQQIMTHPAAQAAFRQRKAMVEPVFSALRQQQGLGRCRRRGLAGVKREFALHALAYHLARAVALSLYRLLGALRLRCQGNIALKRGRLSAT